MSSSLDCGNGACSGYISYPNPQSSSMYKINCYKDEQNSIGNINVWNCYGSIPYYSAPSITSSSFNNFNFCQNFQYNMPQSWNEFTSSAYNPQMLKNIQTYNTPYGSSNVQTCGFYNNNGGALNCYTNSNNQTECSGFVNDGVGLANVYSINCTRSLNSNNTNQTWNCYLDTNQSYLSANVSPHGVCSGFAQNVNNSWNESDSDISYTNAGNNTYVCNFSPSPSAYTQTPESNANLASEILHSISEGLEAANA